MIGEQLIWQKNYLIRGAYNSDTTQQIVQQSLMLMEIGFFSAMHQFWEVLARGKAGLSP